MKELLIQTHYLTCDNKIYCKGLCVACYQKKHRQTPEGKAKLKLYNDTKGKEARIRYLAKQPPKPPKVEQNCECGKIAIVKNFCRKCYHKYYSRAKNNSTPRVRNSFDINLFNIILSEVKNGLTIQKACKKAGLKNKDVMYSKINDEQQTKLTQAKALHRNKNIQSFNVDDIEDVFDNYL